MFNSIHVFRPEGQNWDPARNQDLCPVNTEYLSYAVFLARMNSRIDFVMYHTVKSQ